MSLPLLFPLCLSLVANDVVLDDRGGDLRWNLIPAESLIADLVETRDVVSETEIYEVD